MSRSGAGRSTARPGPYSRRYFAYFISPRRHLPDTAAFYRRISRQCRLQEYFMLAWDGRHSRDATFGIILVVRWRGYGRYFCSGHYAHYQTLFDTGVCQKPIPFITRARPLITPRFARGGCEAMIYGRLREFQAQKKRCFRFRDNN